MNRTSADVNDASQAFVKTPILSVLYKPVEARTTIELPVLPARTDWSFVAEGPYTVKHLEFVIK